MQRAAEVAGGTRRTPVRRRLPETRRRLVSALLVAARSLLRSRSVLGFPYCRQHLFEGRALLLDFYALPQFTITSIQDHSRCGELHCRWDRVVIHDRENLVERGRRALTRKVNQFSFLPREAASVRRSAARQPSTIWVSLRRENFNRACHVSQVHRALGSLKCALALLPRALVGAVSRCTLPCLKRCGAARRGDCGAAVAAPPPSIGVWGAARQTGGGKSGAALAARVLGQNGITSSHPLAGVSGPSVENPSLTLAAAACSVARIAGSRDQVPSGKEPPLMSS